MSILVGCSVDSRQIGAEFSNRLEPPGFERWMRPALFLPPNRWLLVAGSFFRAPPPCFCVCTGIIGLTGEFLGCTGMIGLSSFFSAGEGVGRVVCVPDGAPGRASPRLCSGRSSDRFFLLPPDRWSLVADNFFRAPPPPPPPLLP